MIDVPRWVLEVIIKDGFCCRKCSSPFKKEGIISMGVRSSHRDDEVSVAFFEYECPSCSAVSMIELPFEMTLAEFSTAIIKDIEQEVNEEIAMMERHNRVKNAKKHDPKNGKAKKRSKSRITKAEQKAAMEMLNECKYWDEWLQRIGAPMDFAYLKKGDGQDFAIGQ